MEKTPKLQLAVIITLIGLCVALITLVPVEWMTQSAKFLFAFTITAVSLAILYFKEIGERYREYRKIKDEIGYMPRSIKYEKYRREHYIDPKTGDAEVNYHLKVKNIGEDKLKQVAKSVEFEIPHPTKRGGKSRLNLKSISVDHNELEDPYECYEKSREKREKDGTYLEEGYLQVPLNQIGGLKKGETCNILVQVSSKNAFPSVRNEESVAATIYHQMEVLELIVSVKGNWAIKQIRKTDVLDSIQVYDNVLRILRFDEMNNVPKPEIRGNTISWTIKKPKLSYQYKLLFKVARKRRE